MKAEISEKNHRFLGTLLSSSSSSSIRNLLPRSMSSKRKSKKKLSENNPPLHPNIQINDPPLSPSIPKLSKSDAHNIQSVVDSQLNLQGEINGSDGQSHSALEDLDPAVKVVVRIRAANDHERAVGDDGLARKLSSNSVSIGDRKFNFDWVLDSNSKQEDVFQLVGVPLVKSALAGYNSSILSYGETGSGKTYTMWGPPSAMVDDPSPTSNQGIVPRIFHMLFSEIQREQENAQMKQISYQCRCSFLEIYNDQIGDLLDPVQRNLEIRDDPKYGLYVENLTEEYVSSYEDVTQVLIKGLSNRKVGATSINSKSSRSHLVFTMIIESWYKGTSSKCFSSSKISRITLVDLAGLDRGKLGDAGRQFVREGKSVKHSLSQLGQLVHSLAKGNQPGKFADMSYKGSCLTHLLRESLGGNAKLTVICSISPNNRNNGETLRTLRFGQRVKFIKNEPVINEISEDDVNDLSDQIRQLKEELIKAKSDIEHNSFGSKSAYFKGRRNARESLNHLRVSLNRSLMLPQIDADSDNEMNIEENDVRELCQQLNKVQSFPDDNSSDISDNGDSVHFSSVEESFETDLMSDGEVNGPHELKGEINLKKEKQGVESQDDLLTVPNATDPLLRTSITIIPCRQSAVLHEPLLSESPKIGNTRKSMAIPSLFSASQKIVSESSNFQSDVLPQSLKQSENIRSSLRSSKMFPGPTESLAASLQRGLQIIDYHQQNSASNRSSVSFSFEHLTLKPCSEVDTVDTSLQKSAEHGSSDSLLCASCKQKINDSSNKVQDSLTWMVAAEEAGQVDKDSGNGLAITNNREKDLENLCTEQATKMEQLNQLVEKYKKEREHYTTQGQEGDRLLLRQSKNQMILFEGSADEECWSMKDQNKFERFSVVNIQPGIGVEKCEIEEVMDHENTYFDLKEKEVLLQEIENLRTKLQTHSDTSAKRSTEKLRSSLLAQSIQLRKSVDTKNNSVEEFERERERWTEMESDWISLTDDLRVDLQFSRQHAEKVEMELRLEKKCTEELDDALHRAVLGHARMVEHYTDLQEKYNDLVGKHCAIMEGIAEVKRAAAKAGTKGGTRFAKSLTAELSALRVEREREREFLKKENESLKIQLRDTAEAVHAAGELLARLREAEHAASVAEENFNVVQQENEKLKKQIEKLKRKHKMEMITMKQYMAESRLPESALQTLYREDSDSDVEHNTMIPEDDHDQAWRAEFGAIYQEHYY